MSEAEFTDFHRLSSTDLDLLTLNDLRKSCEGQISVPREVRMRKGPLIAHILEYATVEQKRTLMEALRAVRERIRTGHGRRAPNRTFDNSFNEPFDLRLPTSHDIQQFLSLPSPEQRKERLAAFYDFTSSESVQLRVCAVCARELDMKGDYVGVRPVKSLPNPQCLQPRFAHPEHRLVDGLLLEQSGIFYRDGMPWCHLCAECKHGLEQCNSSLPYKFSLANNLWVGPVPPCLSQLSICEQMLIAQLFPRVYVVKLYAVGMGAEQGTEQRGLRGTVITHALNSRRVVDMVEGRLMPHPLSILPALISVVVVGRGMLHPNKLLQLLRVRRRVVMYALMWLKAHNTKYYGDIVINTHTLNQMPEDDIPAEVIRFVRQSGKVNNLRSEEGGYVNTDPRGNIEEDLGSLGSEPADIPLDSSGTADCDIVHMSANELMLWGLANLWTDVDEGGYVLQRGQELVSDYGERNPSFEDPSTTPNFWERAFPCLFPYGCGGIGASRPVPLSEREHGQLLLASCDHRFRRDRNFPFVLFSSLQRKEALRSSQVQMKRKTFARDARILSRIKLADLEEAKAEESQHKPISNPAIRLLRHHVFAAARRVMGSDANRYTIRNKIWSTTISLCPPTLFGTINLPDVHSPLVQHFGGRPIDIEHPNRPGAPDSRERALLVGSDPYACAKFHHFTMDAIFKHLFGVDVNHHSLHSRIGVLGELSAIVGVWESQQRGSLHLHFLAWMKNAPSCEEMNELLQHQDFRNRLERYISATIRAYLPGLQDKESISCLVKENGVAFCRMPDPRSPTFEDEAASLELRVARAEQIHGCHTARCLKKKHGKLVCKRHAPWPVSAVDFVRENGEWGPKRLYPFVTEWNPDLTICGQCNNNLKLVTNGRDTLNISYYFGLYPAKKQNRDQSSTSSILTDGYAYHQDHPNDRYMDSLEHEQSLLLFRLMNAINSEQVISSQMVISLIMDWGDHWLTHTYTNVYWTSFVQALVHGFPDLECQSRGSVYVQQPSSTQTVEEQVADDDLISPGIEGDTVYCRSQVDDYRFRGERLRHASVFEFFMWTYEQKCPGLENPPSRSVPYLQDHFRHLSSVRVVRGNNHRNLPVFVGRYFPNRDDPVIHDFYCASMLVLLKPWRNITTDLKLDCQTWSDAFTSFMNGADDNVRRIVDNIQYFYQCKRAAEQDRATTDNLIDLGIDMDEEMVEAHEATLESEDEQTVLNSVVEEGGLAESHYGADAIKRALDFNIFPPPEVRDWPVSNTKGLFRGTANATRNIKNWKDQLAQSVDDSIFLSSLASDEHSNTSTSELRELMKVNDYLRQRGARLDSSRPILPFESPEVEKLKEDQFRAYSIILEHIARRESSYISPQPNGAGVQPLRLLVTGCPGTGKSKVIEAVSDTLRRWGKSSQLMKGAYTGIAAALIDGRTIHAMLMTGINIRVKLTEKRRKKQQEFWRPIKQLILDEDSFLDKTTFYTLANAISLGKEGTKDYIPDDPFGGLDVIMFGDFHQFPPVAKSPRERLYHSVDNERDTPEQVLGRQIYEMFDKVVILREQIRVQDPVWQEFLDHVREGNCDNNDVQLLKSMVLNEDNRPNFSDDDNWRFPILITPRHAVRKRWNEAALRAWCIHSGRPLIDCPAQETFEGKKLSPRLAALVSIYDSKKKRSSMKAGNERLPRRLQLAVGSKVMVTKNISMDFDIVNGARGTVEEIIYHPREQLPENTSDIELQRMPICVLVRLEHSKGHCFHGLPANVVPIFPTTEDLYIFDTQADGTKKRYTIVREQLPLTEAYAFTDYRAQGQTLCPILVDIATPDDGQRLSIFNLYVALSRSRGRNTIRILRGFEDRLLFQSVDPCLKEEDERLERLDRHTKLEWLSSRRM